MGGLREEEKEEEDWRDGVCGRPFCKSFLY